MATETGGTTESDVGTESDSGISPYMRGVAVTTTATLSGIAAGVLSMVLELDPTATNSAFIVIAAVLVQFPIYRIVGIDTDDFGTKDYLYIVFMTFVLWFISWGILLTAGTAEM